MDGTLAAVFVIASLTDMALNDCPTGCLATHTAPARLAFQLGNATIDSRSAGQELLIALDAPFRMGPFQPTTAAALTDDGAAYFGAGAKWTDADILPGPLFVEASLLPGLYFPAGGPDLGGNLQFRASVGVGYAFAQGSTLSMIYDHRSNADTKAFNPGLEVLSVRYAVSF